MFVGGSLDLANFELLASDPATLWKGRFWFNTATGLLKYYDGAATVTLPAASAAGILAIANGGTGASTASGARSNLSAAQSGANSDITSLTGLTTPLSVPQGGTGAGTAAGARTSLGAAASGANSDITSLSALSTPLSVAQGGTGATDATGARSNLSAAKSGSNSDITELTGLTTPLSPAQGGTGIANNNAATTTRAGNFAKTETLTAPTSVTYPTSGTLATLAGTETHSNKTHDKLSVNSANDGASGSAQTLSAITATLTRLTAAGSLVSIAGIPQPSPTNQVIVILENRTGVSLSILNENAGAAAANRIITGQGADVTFPSNGAFLLVYDTNSSRWQIVGGATPTGTTSTTKYETTFTATPGATIAHGRAGIPQIVTVRHNELADGQYAYLTPGDFIKADATNLYTSGFGSMTIDETHQLIICAVYIA